MKIFSGGQAGADRAGWDAAIALGLSYGGAIPKGRIAEDGIIPKNYVGLTEMNSTSYPMRSAWNVKNSDATLILTNGHTGRGSRLTIMLCQKMNKPYIAIDFVKDSALEEKVLLWLQKTQPKVLNIAGSRESAAHGIYGHVYGCLSAVLKKYLAMDKNL